jgi:hypothetical protein
MNDELLKRDDLEKLINQFGEFKKNILSDPRLNMCAKMSAESLMQTYKIEKDGDMWCATNSEFINLQESNAGFGESPTIALADLIQREELLKLQLIEKDIDEFFKGENN